MMSESVVAPLKHLLNIWKQQTLTIKCKIKIVNTFALSPLIYISSLIETHPERTKEINYSNLYIGRKTANIAQNSAIQI